MSLDYDLRDIPLEVRTENGHMSRVTECIIFASIPVDIGEITKNNYKEFYLRYCLFNTATYCLYPGFSPVPAFTLEDVYNHIGLKTNVYTMTRHTWSTRKLSKYYMAEAILTSNRQEQEA